MIASVALFAIRAGRFRHDILVALLSPALLVFTPPSAMGDDTPGPDTEGFFAEFAVNTNHMAAEDRGPNDPPGSVFVGENAPGGTFTIAYGFTPTFPLRLSVSGAEHETTDPDIEVQFGSLTLEGGYIFRPGHEVRPYLFGGVGAFSLSSEENEYDFETTGPGGVIGGGLYSILAQHFVFDAALRFDLVSWEKQTARRKLPDGSTQIIETPVDEAASAAKIILGIGWWF
jgi:hypothetical protein